MMLPKNPRDNFRETHQAVAQRVLNNRLSTYIGYDGLLGRDGEKLQAYAQGEGNMDSWSFLALTFRRAGSDASLDVKVEEQHGRNYEPLVDDTGNEWACYSLSCTVNYPCHGSADPSAVLARVELIRDVALLAAEIKAEFGDRKICRLTRTAEKLAELKLQEKARLVTQRVRAAVEANRKNMRVGTDRLVAVTREDLPEGVSPGDYEVQIDEPTGRFNTQDQPEMKQFIYRVLPEPTLGMAAVLERVA